jgi:phosphatidate cytidylyltransferase
MMIKKIMQRLFIFFFGLPFVILMVAFLPYFNHLALNILIIIFSVLGALEFRDILKRKNLVISVWETVLLGAISPLAMTLMVSFDVNDQAIPATFILGASWLLVSRVFLPADKLGDYVSRTIAGFSVMIYPGLFLAWIIRMALKDHSSVIILAFLFMVFANDSAAWASGMFLGRGNRGIVPASPNKSIAGFAGGLAASTLVGLAAGYWFPEAFRSSRAPSLLCAGILGFLTGLAASLGDLGESAFKRSAGIKDSGSLIPGRGGVLDSLDSLSLAAPVYYVVYLFFF